jgi:putative endonuclease
MSFWVYILASARNGTLYIGHTDDLPHRVWQHREQETPGFTSKCGVKMLVYMEPFPTREEARTRERQLKKWNRAWKLELIEKANPEWKDLYLDLNNWNSRISS